MKTAGLCFYRQVAVYLIISLTAPLGVAATAPAQQTPPATVGQGQTPDPSPSRLIAGGTPALPNSPIPVTPPSSSGAEQTQENQESSTSQAAPQPQNTPSQPMGTAAAPVEPGTGVAASRPAGAAIAPARQRRTRSFMIRVGLIVGLGVAVGTVVALSCASPSRP